MTKYKIILNFACGLISMILISSCGGGSSEPANNTTDSIDESNTEGDSNDLQAFDDYIPNDNDDSYQSGDMHINELNLEIKKLQAEFINILIKVEICILMN